MPTPNPRTTLNMQRARHRLIGVYSALLLCLSILMIVGCKTPDPEPCGGECQPGFTCVDGKFCLKDEACKDGQTACGKECVDTKTDVAHCGKCDAKCKDGETCVEGACKEPPKCENNTSACGDKCIDLKNDGSHCGECNKACGKGEVCIDGGCISECPDGEVGCGDACVNLKTSNNHCGACDNKCDNGLTCTDGKCACENDTKRCGNSCVDTDTDDKNCGSCDNACIEGQTCSGGKCSCTNNKSVCGGKCVDTKSDKKNCGRCGNICNDNETCSNGACIIENCVNNQTKCEGKCVDIQTDKEHCGSCGNICGSDKLCIAGECKCAGGKVDCKGTCIDTSADRFHCGQCDNRCTNGESCQGGRCACAPGQLTCDGQCADIQTDNNNCGACGTKCGDGKVCNKGACGCAQGSKLCGNTCIDIQNDKNNCGSCGTQCSGTAICFQGSCGCPSNTKLCDATCADLTNNAKHCGQCSNACASDQICNASKCECASNKKSCNGACVDTQTDNNNCGGCGQACAAGEQCVAGACTCQAPYVTCGTSCVDLQSDAAHCGACSKACATGEACGNGTCRSQWGAQIGGTISSFNHLAIDSAGNAYAVTYFETKNGMNGKASFPKFSKSGLVVQILKDGTIGWYAKLGSSLWVRSINVHSSGNIYVSGYFQGPTTASNTIRNVGDFDAFVAKLNSSGQWQWIRGIGGPGRDESEAVVTDSNENVYVTVQYKKTITIGGTKYNATGDHNGLLIKYNKSGTLQATKHIITSGNLAMVNKMYVDGSDNIYVGINISGTVTIDTTKILGQGGGAALTKFDSTLALKWFSQLDSGQASTLRGIAMDSNGNFFIAGSFSGIITWGSGTSNILASKGGQDIYVAKVSSAGVIQWVKQFGGTNNQWVKGIGIDTNDNILLGGEFQKTITMLTTSTPINSSGTSDMFVSALDSTGKLLWISTGGTSSRDSIKSFVTAGDDYYLAGIIFGKPTFATSTWLGSSGATIIKNLP